MLTGLFIKKPTFAGVEEIFKKEGFAYNDRDVEDLLCGNEKGTRYGDAALLRNEDGVMRKRFIKIPLDGKRETNRLFRRQVNIANGLHKNKEFADKTMAVVKSSLDSPVPYAIFEVRENGEGFGFLHDTAESYNTLKEKDVRRLVETVYAFHRAGLSMEKNVLRYASYDSWHIGHYTNECKKILDRKVLHRYEDGSEARATIEQLFIHYTNIPDVRKRILALFKEYWPYLYSSKITEGSYLVHSDLQLDNTYQRKDGAFELFDFEWVRRTDNPAIAILGDYGHLRARGWFSPSFQSLLDKEMRDIGIAVYKNPSMVEAALKLSNIYWSLKMSRYHMDVAVTLRREKRSEKEYRAMYSSLTNALMQAIK